MNRNAADNVRFLKSLRARNETAGFPQKKKNAVTTNNGIKID